MTRSTQISGLDCIHGIAHILSVINKGAFSRYFRSVEDKNILYVRGFAI